MKIFPLLTIGCCLAAASPSVVATPLHAGLFQSIGEYIWGAKAPPPTLKVLIAHDKEKIGVEVRGGYHLYDPHTNEYLSNRFLSKGQYFQSVSGGLKWGEEFPGIHQLQIIPDDCSVMLVDGHRYHGSLYIYDIGGAVGIVNEVSIERYLRDTLEAKENLSDEALAALAITARTKAYYAAEHPSSRFWAVDAAKVGYLGDKPPHSPTPIERAIAATRYMILSNTTAYEGSTTPFPAEWDTGCQTQEDGVIAKVSLADAETMAKKGDNAAQILGRAFPGAVIALTYR